MIYVTGDTHGNKDWGKVFHFAQNKASEEDTLIIAGDFGSIWGEDTSKIDRYEKLNFTVAFVDGNHEDFDELYRYSIENYTNNENVRVQ